MTRGRPDPLAGGDYEHRMFGIPFPPLKERMDRFECGIRAIRALWRGERRTLRVVAEHADDGGP